MMQKGISFHPRKGKAIEKPNSTAAATASTRAPSPCFHPRKGKAIEKPAVRRLSSPPRYRSFHPRKGKAIEKPHHAGLVVVAQLDGRFHPRKGKAIEKLT